ncbi:MAG: hypothetical protein NVS3B9_6850 [Candidatus Doudnabacteria bacterium]
MLSNGAFVAPQDGSIICSDRGADIGTCYLITNSKKAGFVSKSVFYGWGFSFSNALYGDISWLNPAANIDNVNSAHPTGTLVKINNTIYLLQNDGLWGIATTQIFDSWAFSYNNVVPANSADSSLSISGLLNTRSPGQLTFSKQSTPTIYGSNISTGWQLTVYYTPVEDYYGGTPTSVYGCANPYQSNCSDYLGVHKSDFVNVTKIEGSSKLTSGPYPGKYLSYSPDRGFGIEDTPRGADGNTVVPFSSAAADPSIAMQTSFKIIDCGREDSGSLVDPAFCDKIKNSNWKVTDRFALGSVGKHFDLYIGEENSSTFRYSKWIVDTKYAVIQF